MAALGRSSRVRTIGILVLVLGVAGAGLFYWIRIRLAAPALDDLLPGSTLARDRQVGIMMGTMGPIIMEWLDTLRDPATQAILIAIASALVAAVCFHVARLQERSE